MRYVIAVGGNALTKSAVLGKFSAAVIALSRQGNEVVVTHGNGPQVGELALHKKRNLAQLTWETQGEIGSKIRSSIFSAAKGGAIDVEIVRTHVLVDKNDREFKSPSKPIGPFYKHGDVERLKKQGFAMKCLYNGYRRVVPSPEPKSIVELERIRLLASNGGIVIAAGGGGIAMVKDGNRLRYADAVIDKDLTSALLAVRIRADRLFILTNVDGAFLNFETKKQKLLGRVSVSALQKLVRKGSFEPGSMLPKVQACIGFVKSTGKTAVIGNISKAANVFKLRGATVISE